MKDNILLAGATGNLGGKIADMLISKKANVIAIVRKETNHTKIENLTKKGIKVLQIDMTNSDEIAKACRDVNCVISAFSGLRETIVDSQKLLLDAVVKAGVSRFIPSDYSSDFTNLVPGKNRNLDLRREFHTYLDTKPIKATTIFNGPFMDLLTTDMPLILFKKKKILCWGNPDIKMDFTSTYNVAEYTANVALDNSSPRYLKIAGDTMSANDIKNLMSELSGTKYKLFRPGGIGLLNSIIGVAKFFDRSKTELYPAWQGMQYMRDMMEGRAVITNHDNDRYLMKWTKIKEYLVSENVK
ncbi:MAG: NmrA family NAD(P)-binding protein [Bacteroidetes bacterium]|nr:NmrA family NAD(P)-binding protein [Bacteroidota bacterium]